MFNVDGAESARLAIAVETKDVLATEVSLSPAVAVATVTVFPVRSSVACKSSAVILALAIKALVIAELSITPVLTFVAIYIFPIVLGIRPKVLLEVLHRYKHIMLLKHLHLQLHRLRLSLHWL